MTKKAIHQAFKTGDRKSITGTLFAYYQKVNFYRKPTYNPLVDNTEDVFGI